MIYVALLRGINVGGNNRIDMKIFERVGMKSVKTYINSVNVIFEDSTTSKEELTSIIEKAINEDFTLMIKLLIRSLDDMQLIMGNLPANWKKDQEMKSDILFFGMTLMRKPY